MKTVVSTHHCSVELLGGVIVIVLVASPVTRVRQEPALGRGHAAGVATKVPLQGDNKILSGWEGGREGGREGF